MVNINKRDWEDLELEDIKEFLGGYDKENFFFELKSDKVSTTDFIKEVSAFANTYGGYIFLGIEDDAMISGCEKWSENKIHTTMHDSISPLPQFDVKQFVIEGKTVIIVKIEEGTMPPYITNKGYIYRRVSSGSYIIKQSAEIDQLNRKREDQIDKIHKTIELPDLPYNMLSRSNICGYVDIGFSMVFSVQPELQKHFYAFDLTKLYELISQNDLYHMSQVGHSYIIMMAECKNQDGSGALNHGIQNFIEIMSDGSVRIRMIILGDPSKDVKSSYCADINTMGIILMFKQFYQLFFEDVLPDKFICAYKYQKLTVLNQFTAKLDSLLNIKEGNDNIMQVYQNQVNHFGEPVIIEGNRIPPSDFEIIDPRYIEQYYGDFNTDILMDSLFSNAYLSLGYIPNPISEYHIDK